MFNTISWSEYLTILSLATAGWYMYVLLRFNRPTTAIESSESLPPVIGAIKTDNPTLEPEQLYFGSSQPDDISDQTLAPGHTDELLAETQTLVEAFCDTPNKSEFLSLLAVLLSKYEPYGDEIDLKIIRPLAAQLPFPIDDQEWPKF